MRVVPHARGRAALGHAAHQTGHDHLRLDVEARLDAEHGGLLYFTDLRGLPVQEYWHDMKFWWPHNEAIIGTLVAWQLTGEPRFAEMHRLVHEWSFAHFPDAVHGEWYGWLHRDGSVSSRAKGSMWKGPFHLPRCLWYCWRELDADLQH